MYRICSFHNDTVLRCLQFGLRLRTSLWVMTRAASSVISGTVRFSRSLAIPMPMTKVYSVSRLTLGLWLTTLLLFPGTLQWKAPESFNPVPPKISYATDVYAFAMTCVEVLTQGQLPWPELDDSQVKKMVCGAWTIAYVTLGIDTTVGVAPDNKRPDFPMLDAPWNSKFAGMIASWWNQDPSRRPSFRAIVKQTLSLSTTPVVQATPACITNLRVSRCFQLCVTAFENVYPHAAYRSLSCHMRHAPG